MTNENEKQEHLLKETQKTSTASTKVLKKSLYIYILVLFVAISFTVGLVIGNRTFSNDTSTTQDIINKNGEKAEQVDFQLFWDTWNKLNSKHVDRPFNKQQLLYGAIKGMIEATEDPYSGFLDPEETSMFNSQIEGKFEGIGAEVGIQDNILTIISPLPESPAEQAGAKPQDQILKIDNTSTEGLGIDEAIQKIRGPKGSIVKLTIRRPASEETLEIQITRDTIHVDSVKLEFIDDNIAHLQIRNFGNGTVQEINDAADEIVKRNAKGIILDVRNNPGGLLDVAINVTSLFVDNGQVVVIEDKGNGNRNEYKSARNNKLKDIPLVILQNEGSASASEITAGALRDIRGTTIIGAKSFGKGSVQDYELLPIKDDGEASLRITIAKWLTPKGASIHNNGIDPDIAVEFTKEDVDNHNDPQLNKAIEEILK